jgi:hypothetical protein
VEAVKACHPAANFTIALELTRSEIADVQVSGDPASRACVTEAVWATPLVLDHPAEHATVQLSI